MRIRSRGPWRHVTALTTVLALAVVAAACGGNSPSSAPDTTAAATDATSSGAAADTSTVATEAPAPESTAPVLTNAPTTTVAELEPQSGGSVTVGIDADATGYNPTLDAWGPGAHTVARTIFDTLATYDATGKVVPYLAESITANEDATVWTITLRDGVTFHDGTPLDAEALKINFDANKGNPVSSSALTLMQETRVIDPLTLELQMSQPWATFPNLLTGDVGAQVGYVAAPAMLAAPDGGRTPIGTGPFVLQEWVPDSQLTVVRNESYWQRPAYLDEVTFRPIPDSSARKAAFDAGDIDVYSTGSSSEIIEYQESPDEFTTVIGAPGEPDVIMFNTTAPPLDDVRVRRALVMATDLTRVFDFLDATGVKQITSGPYADGSFWAVDTNYPEYDPEGARQLIVEYVAETGNEVRFDFNGNQVPIITTLQELYQSMWAEVGATADIVSKAQSENIQDAIDGNFQVMMWGGIGGGDPDADFDDFHSGVRNFARFSTPEIDAALEAGRALADPEARKEQYAIVQQALGENVPYLWAGSNQYAVITRPDVTGIADFRLPDDTPGQAITSNLYFLKDVWLLP